MSVCPVPATLADTQWLHELDRAHSPVFADPEQYARLIDEAGMVLVAPGDNGSIVAFAAWSRVLDEASLLNLIVEPAHRRRGLAALLLTQSIDRLRHAGITTFHLEVRESNIAAIALYGAHGFAISGRRRAYYASLGRDRPREDALLMTLDAERSEVTE